MKDIVENTIPAAAQVAEERLIQDNYESTWVDTETVGKIMEKFQSKRCSGYDRIPLCFFKDGKDELLPVVTKLMQKIFMTNIIPEQWKVAKVIPIYKKGDRKDPNNYRPISNLCSVTKIFERLILERIKMIEVKERCDLTGEKQHGFKEKRSTETAGLELQSMISGWCDTGEYVTMTSLDLSAAFDVVDHKLLIKKLKQIGLPKIITAVIGEWLRDRLFYCDINGKTSTLRKITHGTVQGSILGPVLFAIFTRSISKQAKDISTFADDNFILEHHHTLERVIELAKRSICAVSDWLTSIGMKVNETKTEICIFHKKDVQHIIMDIRGLQIEVKNSIKVLGVIFDTKMNWNNQARNAMNKANKAKQALSLIRKYFTEEEMIKLATAYFYSTLYYGAKIWLSSSISAVIKKKLWQLSSYMLRLVDGWCYERQSFETLHKKYNRASPMDWCNYTTAVAMWNVVNNQVPSCAHLKMMHNVLHQERRQGILFTRSNQTKIGFNCISNRLQVVSSKLHLNWQDMSDTAFKAMCKKVFITNREN